MSIFTVGYALDRCVDSDAAAQYLSRKTSQWGQRMNDQDRKAEMAAIEARIAAAKGRKHLKPRDG